jgi:hypothetical protein
MGHTMSAVEAEWARADRDLRTVSQNPTLNMRAAMHEILAREHKNDRARNHKGRPMTWRASRPVGAAMRHRTNEKPLNLGVFTERRAA